jgi:hypothetical protein
MAQGRVLTVRFVLRGGDVRIIGAVERTSMKKKTNKNPKFDAAGYQMGAPNIQGEPVDFDALGVLPRDFLPTLEELAGKSPQTKITLAVDDEALAFFKGEAKRMGTSYQRMMRNLLASYAWTRKLTRAGGSR